MYRYKKYIEWISDQKITSFVSFLDDPVQNGSRIPITFKKFLEMAELLFGIYFVEQYMYGTIFSNRENYRDFINRVENEFRFLDRRRL